MIDGLCTLCSGIAGAGLALVLLIAWNDVIRMIQDIWGRSQLASVVLGMGLVMFSLAALSLVIIGIWGAFVWVINH